jgi:peptide/nickel transport system substrate-binding protein
MSGYTAPADATGLSASYASWRDGSQALFDDWTKYDAAAAAAALDEAGLRRGADGVRVLPDGRPFAPTIAVVNGWSDWVRAAQVVSRGLEAVGVRASVRLLDQGAWFQRLQEGGFDLAIAWSNEGATPYDFYRWLMRPEDVRPLGEPAPGNWHRYGSEAARPVFDAWERARDPSEERALAARLQRLFVEEAPAIPLFPNPSWGEYNSSRFEGFPDAGDPWAALSPNKVPDCLLVLVALRPREGASR